MYYIYSIYFILLCLYFGPTYANSPAIVSVSNDNVTNLIFDVPDISEFLEKFMENTIVDNPMENEVGQVIDKVDPDIEADVNLTTPQLIIKYGYHCEVHHVITTDGYILEMHRITGGSKYPPREGKSPVLLMHGLLDSSATWVLMRPSHGLAYILADEGYDVWMGNCRGNIYSKRHAKYNPEGDRNDRRAFWSFSFHEIGLYDLPAKINYILTQTNRTKLHYIGHSQGTTAFFVMCSMKPEYNEKIILMNGLAPVAYMSHVYSPFIHAIAPFLTSVEIMANLFGIYEFLPSNEVFILAGRDVCVATSITEKVCENIMFLVGGYKSDQLNVTMVPIILGHTPAGASMKQMEHYGQEVRSGHFRQFDYGFFENMAHYRNRNPPSYNIKNIKSKIVLYYASDDWLTSPKDIERFAHELPNLIGSYLIPHKKFNHLDFVWGIDVRRLVYDNIINEMKHADNTDT